MDQELVQYLEERFQGVNRQFAQIDQRFERIDQRFEGIDRRFDEVNERIEEVKRHSGVLVEGLRHELHLVAEGLTMHIEVRHREDREYFDRKFEDTHALLRSFHQRIENLERNRPN